MEHENAALRSRVAELERTLARFRAGEEAPAGASIEEREALLSEAERIAHMGSWVWDPKSGAVVWSNEMFRIWGHEPGAVVPSLEVFYAGIHPGDMAEFQAASRRGLETGEAEQVEFRVVQPSGAVRQVTMNSMLLFDEAGQLQRVVGTALDTTERDDLEEQLRHAQKMEAIGRLAGGIAHDFNNLLTVVLGSASLLEARAPSDELSDIIEAARSAAELTRQLLAFGRRAVLNRRSLDINQTIETSKRLLAQAVGARVQLDLDLASELWPARLDAPQLQQILMNLAVNARDAMPDGGRFHIRTRNLRYQAAAGVEADGVELTVSDTGQGMDAPTRERIFEPFFTTKAVGSGTGLGLAVVFGAVQQSGGTIEVRSLPGTGTTFHIVFPRDVDEARVDSRAPSVGLPFDRLTRGVLTVDDDPDVLRVVAGGLRAHGIEVLEAPSPQHALQLLKTRDFDLVIADLVMPAMSGYELARRLWTLRPEMPVLFMTGLMPEQADAVSETKTWALLRKPFRLEQLMGEVAQLVGRSPVGSVSSRSSEG